MTLPLTRAELAALLAEQPAWPSGPPNNQWEAHELHAFILAHDAQIAAQQRPVAPVPSTHIRKVKVAR